MAVQGEFTIVNTQLLAMMFLPLLFHLAPADGTPHRNAVVCVLKCMVEGTMGWGCSLCLGRPTHAL